MAGAGAAAFMARARQLVGHDHGIGIRQTKPMLKEARVLIQSRLRCPCAQSLSTAWHLLLLRWRLHHLHLTTEIIPRRWAGQLLLCHFLLCIRQPEPVLKEARVLIQSRL